MPVEFRCTQCDKLLRTPDETRGQQAKCPACGAVVTVPEMAPPQVEMGYDSGHGSEPVNPYQSPGEMASAGTPFAPASPTAPIRPTRIDFSEVFSQTWQIFTEQWAMCLGVAIVVLVINFVADLAGRLVAEGMFHAGEAGVAVGVLIIVASNLFQLWMKIGMTIFFINTVRGRQAEFANIFGGTPYFLRVLGGGILYMLAILLILGICVAPGALIGSAAGQEGALLGGLLGGGIGMIGATVFALTFFPFFYLIIDQNMGIIDSFVTAREITEGNRVTVFGIWLVTAFAGGAIILFTCGAGLLAVVPFMALLWPVLYLLMIGHATAARQSQAFQQPVDSLPPEV